jgi:predicted permease
MRSMARRKEIGVRLAMGASRGRVTRQLCIESLILAIAGGALGALLAFRGAHVLLALMPPSPVPTDIDLTPDMRALAISFAIASVTGLLFGVAPALAAARVDVASVIRDEAELRRVGRWRFSARRAVVSMQIALSVVLAVCAGLFMRTVARLAATPTGFDVEHVVMATIEPSQNRYTPASATTFYRALEDRLAATPGVQAVGSSMIPLLGGEQNYVFRTMRVPGMPKPADGTTLLSHVVDGNLFAATGLQVLSGRALNASDGAGSPLVAVLNEAAARKYFRDENPLGRTVRFGPQQMPTIVGIVRDAKYRTLRENPPATVYTTFEQDTGMVSGLDRTLYARTSGSPTEFAATLRAVVRDLDVSMPVFSIRTLSEQKRLAMSGERVVARLCTFAGGIALLLATIGLYGLIAFDLQRRTRELGVRISLGATRRTLTTMVLRGAVAMVIVGMAIGLLVSRGVSRFVAAQLYGVGANDPMVIAIACMVLAGVTLIATLVPAWRATNVNPVEALRCE